MAISERLKAYLQTSKVKYTAAKHAVVYTAQEIAASQHVPGRQLAKCVLVLTDKGPVLVVLSAIYLIDLKRLKTLLRAKTVSIGKEADIKRQFPDIEVGAMSPFGNLYQIRVAMDRVLADSDKIVFNAGSHTDTIAMRGRDVVALVKPTVGNFGLPVGGQAKRKTRAGAKKGSSKSKGRKPAKRTAARKRPTKKRGRR